MEAQGEGWVFSLLTHFRLNNLPPPPHPHSVYWKSRIPVLGISVIYIYLGMSVIEVFVELDG